MGLITITAAVVFITAVPKTRAANGDEVFFGKIVSLGVAVGQFVELAAHNDFCSAPAGVRFAVVDAVSGALLGPSVPMQMEPGQGVLIRPFGVTGPSTRMFIRVGAGISCPAANRFGGQDQFPAVLELVDKVTEETIRRVPLNLVQIPQEFPVL